MKKAIFAILATPTLVSCQAEMRSAAPEGDWLQLFNGRDLDGWTPKFTGFPLGENFADTFRVRDGAIVIDYSGYEAFDDRYGHLFYDVQPFSHYWIRAEYRFVGEQVAGAYDWAWRNNGLMLHAQPPHTMATDQEWPVSIEMRLLGGKLLGGRRPTGNLCAVDSSVLIDGRRTSERCTDSRSDTFRGDQWVRVEAEVQGGDLVRHFVNGEEVMSYAQPMANEQHDWLEGRALTSGYIAIQAESHPTEFRLIEILDLSQDRSATE